MAAAKTAPKKTTAKAPIKRNRPKQKLTMGEVKMQASRLEALRGVLTQRATDLDDIAARYEDDSFVPTTIKDSSASLKVALEEVADAIKTFDQVTQKYNEFFA